MTDFALAGFDAEEFVTRVLAEDLGEGGDVTSAATIAPQARFTAEMNGREPIVVAGIALAEAFFRRLDPEVIIERLAEDGAKVAAGAVLLRLSGNARAMLAAERSALNTLQHLSGIATLTRRYVDAIDGTGAILLDTRKTIPGLRALDKYAAKMGGAHNHRLRMDDGLLIKDNHIGVAGGVADAVRAAKAAATGLPIQVEVDRVAVRYASLSRLVADLRAMAATNMLNARPRSNPGKAWAERLSDRFDALIAETEAERFDLLHFLAWSPAAH